jgi:hypothetical protein
VFLSGLIVILVCHCFHVVIRKGGGDKATKSNDAPSFEIQSTVSETMTDEEGNGLNGQEFMTVEDQRMIQKCYLDLTKIYEEVEKEMMKQGDAEQQRRREFLESCVTQG